MMIDTRFHPTTRQVFDAVETVKSPLSQRADLEDAAAILAFSPFPEHRTRASEVRAALYAQPGAELKPEARKVAALLARQMGSDTRLPTAEEWQSVGVTIPHQPEVAARMAQNFEALDLGRVNTRRAQFFAGCLILGFALVAGIHVALAAPGKIARTDAVFQQIEASR